MRMCKWNIMLMHKYKFQYTDIMKITVDIPTRLWFSKMSVLRCEPGEMTGTGRWTTQVSGAGSYLLVNGRKPRSSMRPSQLQPILGMICSFLCEVQLQETHRQVTKWGKFVAVFYHFFPKSTSLNAKQVYANTKQYWCFLDSAWVNLLFTTKHLHSKDQAMTRNSLYM